MGSRKVASQRRGGGGKGAVAQLAQTAEQKGQSTPMQVMDEGVGRMVFYTRQGRCVSQKQGRERWGRRLRSTIRFFARQTSQDKSRNRRRPPCRYTAASVLRQLLVWGLGAVFTARQNTKSAPWPKRKSQLISTQVARSCRIIIVGQTLTDLRCKTFLISGHTVCSRSLGVGAGPHVCSNCTSYASHLLRRSPHPASGDVATPQSGPLFDSATTRTGQLSLGR